MAKRISDTTRATSIGTSDLFVIDVFSGGVYVTKSISADVLLGTALKTTINLTGLPVPGPRGPLFVWNNPSSTAAGENGCAQFWMGDNPTGTPGANEFVCVTISAFNGNGRSPVWGQNIVAQQGNLGTGWVDGPLIGLEIDMQTGWQSVPNTFSNMSTFKKIGLEIFNDGLAVGNFNVTSAIAIWAPDTTGTCWFYEGIALSRVLNNGIVFYKDPDTSDGIAAFATSAILDQSASATSYKVTGSHTNGIDLSGGTFSGSAFKSPGYKVDGSGNLFVGSGATNGIGLGISLSVNNASGNVGVQLQTAASTRAYWSTDGSTFVQLTTAGAIPLLLGVNNATAVTVGTDKSLTLAGKLKTLASATGAAGISVPSGTAPTSPTDGDMWYDGTNVKFRVGATTKTFTLT